jgi:putative ABC transport system permease protein
MLFLKLLRESYRFALQAIWVNKIRTILTLMGITIGIFAVISVFTVFDSVEKQIRENINELGSNVLFVQKWPWAMGHSEYPWRKYINRPEPSVEELEAILNQSPTTEHAAFMTGVNRTVERGSVAIKSVTVIGTSYQYDKVIGFELASGRYFTPIENNAARNVGLIGYQIKETLFGHEDPIGKTIKVGGHKVMVIGLIKEEGDDPLGDSHDERIILPINYLKTLANLHDVGASIMVKAKPGSSVEQLKAELTSIMRSARRLKPGTENNFAINETSLLTEGFESFFSIISIVGWIVGGFSLLVGGFGIANIMFVSVKERTSQIGIQKSLGAKKYFIMLQFLFEAVFLSLIGGILGLLLVYLGTVLVNTFDLGILFLLTPDNIILAVSVSAVIGLVAGLVPAYNASKLDPVEAMRTI